MKTTFGVDRFRRARLLGEPGEYDGRPQLAERFVDLAPQKINRFREAAASALPFLERVNGSLDTEKPFYPLTASILREYGEPFEILASNIEWSPTDIPSGSGRLVIRLASDDEPVVPAKGGIDVFEMVLVRSDVYHGSLSTTTGCVVASNAWLTATLEGGDAPALTVLAFGMLFAEDFDARVLEIRGVPTPGKSDVLTRMAESTGLQLRFN